MSKEKETPAVERDMEELVDYMAPILPDKEDQSVFVQVNGESIRLKRGENVKIKRKFAEVLTNAARQEMKAYAYMRAAQGESAKALAEL